MNQEFLKSCITEHHNYARHIFTSVVGWFTFFVTINYASMGWLASASDKIKENLGPVYLIAFAFITQNILGIIICIYIKGYLISTNRRLFDTQYALLHAHDAVSQNFVSEDTSDIGGQTCLPLRLYNISM
ncbi:MAG: hypothetical protein WAT12_04685, partial [Candidatus Nitrotoga sp.]